MGRSRRRPGTEYEDERRINYGRSRGRERSGAGTAVAAAAIIILMLSGAFLYLKNTVNTSEETVSVNFASPIDPGTEADIRESSSAEAQSIHIIVTAAETAPETEPETPPAPKYTESKDTKLIEPHNEYVISVTFAGDILFDDRYSIMASAISRAGANPSAEVMFDAETLSIMRDSDIFMVNNEFPYSESGTPLAEKKFTFRAKPGYAALLDEMGADIVALANNHMYDHGETALLDTLSTLKSLKRSDSSIGMPYVGAGVNIDEAAAPFYFTNGDIKIGFIAATQIERMSNPDTKGATGTSPGVFRCLDYKKLCEVITGMKDECDFIVAYLHWGTESTANIDEHQKKLAAAVRDAGADLIIGDHPHVLQGITVLEAVSEEDAGVPCIYSLGNYLFNSNSQDTCLVTAYLDPKTAKLVSFRFLPARQEGCRTHLLTGTEKERVLTYMRSISSAEIDADGFVKLR